MTLLPPFLPQGSLQKEGGVLWDLSMSVEPPLKRLISMKDRFQSSLSISGWRRYLKPKLNKSDHALSSLGLLTALFNISASADAMVGWAGLVICLIVCIPIGRKPVPLGWSCWLRCWRIAAKMRIGNLEWTVILVCVCSIVCWRTIQTRLSRHRVIWWNRSEAGCANAHPYGRLVWTWALVLSCTMAMDCSILKVQLPYSFPMCAGTASFTLGLGLLTGLRHIKWEIYGTAMRKRMDVVAASLNIYIRTWPANAMACLW